MIKEFLDKNKISVYRCSKESGIPYTTLNEIVLGKKKIEDCSVRTIKLIADYFGVSMEEILGNKTNQKSIANDWEEKKNKKFIFPVIVETNDFDISRVHPLMQRDVLKVYETLKDNKTIKKIYLFGSSTNIRCNIKSDLDFAIELNNYSNENKNSISEKIGLLVNYNCDIVWMDKVIDNDRLLENINRGVVIYEQNVRTC